MAAPPWPVAHSGRLTLFFALLAAACGLPPGAAADGAAEGSRHAHPCDPRASGLLITEIMANPTGPDAGREWLELYNMGEAPLCLDGAELHIGLPWAPKARTLTQVGCLPPKGLWVLGDGAAAPGTAPPYVVHHRWGAMALPNGQGAVAISCDGTVLAAVEYGAGDVPTPVSGRALARVPMAPWGSFCVVAGEADAQGNVGSPGRVNPGCSSCRDDEGVLRPVREAAPGALHAQVLPPQAGAAPGQAAHPWGSVLLRAQDTAVDLAGLTLEARTAAGHSRAWSLPEGPCHTLAPGMPVELPLGDVRQAAGAGPAWLGRRAPPRGAAAWAVRQGRLAIAEPQGGPSQPPHAPGP